MASAYLSISGTIRYGEETIAYQVRRQAARSKASISIHVEPDGRVLVDAPQSAGAEAIRHAVAARARWISKHLSDIRQRLHHVLPRSYVSGESHWYLGRRYTLKMVTADMGSDARLKGGHIEIGTAGNDADVARQALGQWYRERTRKLVDQRLAVLVSELSWVKSAPSVRLRLMNRQWGSCSPAGLITLHALLSKAPRECVDYVLLHEMCHLREHNHSKKFYRLLDRHMPDWQRVKTRLDGLSEQILNV